VIFDNRIHPRVAADFPCDITADDNVRLLVRLANISVGGLMITASQQDFETLLANSRELQLNRPVEADLSFALVSQPSMADRLQVRCRAVYVRRRSQDKYFIGFKFLNPSAHCQAAVNRYLNEHLGPGSGR